MDKGPDAFRTISEVAEDLDVPQHVLRFWETRFSQIKPLKRGGGRRYYRPDDVDLLRGIRHLLYGEGYTIKGVQRILKEEGVRFVQSAWQEGAVAPPKQRGTDIPPSDADEDDEDADGPLFASPVGERAHDRSEALLGHERRDARAPAAGERQNELHGRQVPEPTGLAPDDLRILQAVLTELGECRRLLAAARDSDDGGGDINS
ncbi:MerR family transcriptional regulator [Chelatococcus sp. SYSU_G07232]|uniref:MerR family transcriptional regulator n=1 Tax=Chelatococcus albus TaxID=3047466 RepID=A0ABT7AC29_9HYPH|nr:MerR family transcriptional regulator [Chelatococcus sp. SYSU_G07232]MDJ1156921.1 MerR family transcriptional regulator [Chelatococcus sp. SYSU_G07232]